MDVACWQKLLSACRDPPFPSGGLTLRAMPVSAGVVRDRGTMPAASALIQMPAQCGGATPCDGQQHFDMLPADPLAASLEEGSSRGADEIGHLQGRPAHLFLLYGAVFQLQRVQRAGGRVKMALRKMQIDGGLFQIAVAQQDLNGAQIGACFEQISGEAVTQRVGMDLFLDAGSLGGLLAGVPDGLGVAMG